MKGPNHKSAINSTVGHDRQGAIAAQSSVEHSQPTLTYEARTMDSRTSGKASSKDAASIDDKKEGVQVSMYDHHHDGARSHDEEVFSVPRRSIPKFITSRQSSRIRSEASLVTLCWSRSPFSATRTSLASTSSSSRRQHW